jgi:hypothetical protein
VAAILLAIGLAPAAASAGELELTGYLGSVFPFYEQSFEFDPGTLPGLPPGVSVEQQDVLHLDGKGGLALGAGASWQFTPWLGLEGRVDTADVSVRITGARYLIRVHVGPIADLTSELVLGGGDADLHRLYPVSLNLRARTSGRTRIGASAGVSYLPSFDFLIVQRATLQPVAPLPLPAVGATVTLEAAALPAEQDEGRLGANAGVFVQFGIGDRLSLVAEGRYFHFRRQTLTWGAPRVEPELPVIGQTVVEEIAGQLEPVDFNPTFFQATAGLALRF